MSLSILFWETRAFSIERRDWVFTQLSSSSLPVSNPNLGFQLGVSMLTYDSYSSTQGSLFWDSKWVEVGARLSGKLLGSLGVGRTSLGNSLSSWDETYSFEIARRFISPDGRFGRIGIQYDTFLPQKERFLHFTLDTGILESPTENGLLKLSFHLFRPQAVGSDTRMTSLLDTGYVFYRGENHNVRAGLGIGWTYHLSQEQEFAQVAAVSDNSLKSEHMLFSFNPWLEYSSQNWLGRLSIPLRLFMDKQWQIKTFQGENVLVVSYPFEISIPDLSLSLVFFW